MLRWGNKTSDSAAPSAVPPAPVPVPHPPAPATGTPAQRPVRRASLARLLLEAGKVPEDALRRAIRKQKETGEFLGEILVQEGLLDERSLTSFLAKHCKIPHLSLLDYLVEKDLLELVPEELCRRYRVLPIDKLGRNLTVAMVNPLNTEAIEEIQVRNPDLRIKPILCAYQHYVAVTRRLFGTGSRPGEMAELTVSSLGLKIPRENPAPKPTPEVTPAHDASEDDIPDALEVYDSFDTDEVLQDGVDEAVQPEEAVSAGDAAEPKCEEAIEAPEELREVVGAMMDSVRDTYTMIARRLKLFHDVRPEDVALIFSRGVTREYETGQTIFESGAKGEEMFVILGGRVEIHEGERIISTLERGAMFGEMALFSDKPRSASARAVDHTSLLALSHATLQEDLSPNVTIQLLLNIIITLSDRLRAFTGPAGE